MNKKAFREVAKHNKIVRKRHLEFTDKMATTKSDNHWKNQCKTKVKETEKKINRNKQIKMSHEKQPSQSNILYKETASNT